MIRRIKRTLYILVPVSIGLVFGEIGARIYFEIANESVSSVSKYKYDNVLGWSLRSGDYSMRHRDFDVMYTVSEGMRNTVYDPKNRIVDNRINIFGDSFAFGIGVSDANTISSHVANELSNCHVKNYGVSGYAPDQYFLSREKHSNPGDMDVFVMFTGNDYHELNTSRSTKNFYKPFLKEDPNWSSNFQWVYPKTIPGNKNSELMAVNNTSYFSSKLLLLVKAAAKNVEWVVELRNAYATPDKKLVELAISRIGYLFSDVDKQKIFFVIVPSYSLTQNISVATSEGYYQKKLNSYLRRSGFKYIDLHEIATLNKLDYWPHEGHPNEIGNTKIAGEIAIMLSKYSKCNVHDQHIKYSKE